MEKTFNTFDYTDGFLDGIAENEKLKKQLKTKYPNSTIIMMPG